VFFLFWVFLALYWKLSVGNQLEKGDEGMGTVGTVDSDEERRPIRTTAGNGKTCHDNNSRQDYLQLSCFAFSLVLLFHCNDT
jgi:hypothetical protein